MEESGFFDCTINERNKIVILKQTTGKMKKIPSLINIKCGLMRRREIATNGEKQYGESRIVCKLFVVINL